MDGIDNNESLVNTIVIFPAIEDIAEFKTTTNVAPAEFGRAGGAVVQVVTKSGTNQIHGSAYWFNRSKIAAADVFQYTDNPHCTHLGESGCVALPEPEPQPVRRVAGRAHLEATRCSPLLITRVGARFYRLALTTTEYRRL